MTSFVKYFSENVTPVKMLTKEKSLLMKLISFILSILTFLHIVDFPRRIFMGYITTVGNRVYIPDGAELPMGVLLHELCHVLQFRQDGMWLRYILSREWRAYYESTADQAWMLAYPYGWEDAYLRLKAINYTRYGIPFDMIYDALVLRRREVREASWDIHPQGVAAKVVQAYRFWKTDPCTNNQ